jgi:hypothetical protein
VKHVSVDLLDAADAKAKLAGLKDATHVFFAAFQPGSGPAADAGLRLLQARFHDSYEQDPLEWKIDERALASQIQLAQDLLARFPEHAAREDIEFIAAILYTRAARLPKGAERYAPRARAATEAFAARYPASLRAAAMPVLREALPPR